jgi:hypothetical protein
MRRTPCALFGRLWVEAKAVAVSRRISSSSADCRATTAIHALEKQVSKHHNHVLYDSDDHLDPAADQLSNRIYSLLLSVALHRTLIGLRVPANSLSPDSSLRFLPRILFMIIAPRHHEGLLLSLRLSWLDRLSLPLLTPVPTPPSTDAGPNSSLHRARRDPEIIADLMEEIEATTIPSPPVMRYQKNN